MIFAQCNRRQAANIVLEALGSKTARPSARGSLPARSEILIPRGVWRSIERNAPEAFKSAIALIRRDEWACRRKSPPASCLSRGRQPELRNQPHHRWRDHQVCVTSPILSGRLVRAQRAVCMWVDRQGASPTYRGREFPRHNSQLAQLPSNCAPSLLGHQAVSRTTIGSFRCFRLQNGCGRKLIAAMAADGRINTFTTRFVGIIRMPDAIKWYSKLHHQSYSMPTISREGVVQRSLAASKQWN